jgi:hypothetical protein
MLDRYTRMKDEGAVQDPVDQGLLDKPQYGIHGLTSGCSSFIVVVRFRGRLRLGVAHP